MSWALPLGFFVPIAMAIGVGVVHGDLPDPAWMVIMGGWAITFLCGIFVGSYDARHR